MVFLGLNMPLSLSIRGSGTSTTPLWTSIRPAEAVVGVLLRVSALNRVVFPDWGRPMIPSFILTLCLGVVYFGALKNKPEWRNRQTRTTQNRVPKGMWVRFPPSALKLYPIRGPWFIEHSGETPSLRAA